MGGLRANAEQEEVFYKAAPASLRRVVVAEALSAKKACLQALAPKILRDDFVSFGVAVSEQDVQGFDLYLGKVLEIVARSPTIRSSWLKYSPARPVRKRQHTVKI